MPLLIEYASVHNTLIADGMQCHYPNGGAFGFPPAAKARILGWIGPSDPTIRDSMLSHARQIPAPIEQNLVRLALETWRRFLPGIAWIMPASHWSYELQHGNGEWLSPAVRKLGLDSEIMAKSTRADAIQFAQCESDLVADFLHALLSNLAGSDFSLAFPNRKTICTIHHHKQLWWVTTDGSVAAQLKQLSTDNM